MIKKPTKNTYIQLEKVLTIAGIALVIIGCVANAYSVYTNLRFITQPLDLIYYFRNIILLGGGFAIGYLLTKKSGKNTRQDKLFAGVFYVLIAAVLFWMVDLLRVGLQNVFGFPSFPWGRIVFEGGPLLALMIALAIAYVSQRKPNRSAMGAFAKITLVVSFAIYQLYILIPSAGADFSNTSMWLMIAGYLTTPLAIALVSFLLLKNVKSRFDRTFYASFIGAVYAVLIYALWDFRMDVTSEATNIFSIVVTLISLAAVSAILWRVRRAVK